MLGGRRLEPAKSQTKPTPLLCFILGTCYSQRIQPTPLLGVFLCWYDKGAGMERAKVSLEEMRSSRRVEQQRLSRRSLVARVLGNPPIDELMALICGPL
jgi:hypothetical protein